MLASAPSQDSRDVLVFSSRSSKPVVRDSILAGGSAVAVADPNSKVNSKAKVTHKVAIKASSIRTSQGIKEDIGND